MLPKILWTHTFLLALGLNYALDLQLQLSPKTIVASNSENAAAPVACTVEITMIDSLERHKHQQMTYKAQTQSSAGGVAHHTCNPQGGGNTISKVLCTISLTGTGSHGLTLLANGTSVGSTTLFAFEQPHSLYLRPTEFSLVGMDFFTIKLAIDHLPAQDAPRVRFQSGSSILPDIIPDVVKQGGHIFFSGMSPAFDMLATDLRVFFSLNGVQFAEVHGENSKSLHVVEKPTFKIAYLFHTIATQSDGLGWNYWLNQDRLKLNNYFGPRVKSWAQSESVEEWGPDACGDHCSGPNGWCTNDPVCSGLSGLTHQSYMEGKRAIDEGADMVVASSFGHGPDMVQLAKEYPHKHFVHLGSPTAESSYVKNVAHAGGKIFQGAFMMGYALGLHPDFRANPKLGYLTAFEDIGVLDWVLAMFKGIAEAMDGVLPEVYIVYTSTFASERRQQLATERLFKYYDVQAISCNCNSIMMNKIAKDYGRLSLGANALDYGSKIGDSVVCGVANTPLQQTIEYVETAMAGIPWGDDTADDTGFLSPPSFYYFGLDKGAAQMAPLTSAMPQLARRKYDARLAQFLEGQEDVACNWLRVNGTKIDYQFFEAGDDSWGVGECRSTLYEADYQKFKHRFGVKDSCDEDSQLIDGQCFLGYLDLKDREPDDCPPGLHLTLTGCVPCPPGQRAVDDTCLWCPQGTIAKESGQSECTTCEEGTMSVQQYTDLGKGLHAPPGTYIQKSKDTKGLCEILCAENQQCAGFFFGGLESASSEEDHESAPHEVGTCWLVASLDENALSVNASHNFHRREPLTQCLACPDGQEYVTLPLQKPKCRCKEGFTQLAHDGTYLVNHDASQPCSACPEGLICPAGHPLQCSSGFYCPPEKPLSTSEVYLCPGDLDSSACKGQSCAGLREGFLCELCPDGYVESDEDCIECRGSDVFGSVILIFFALCLIPALAYGAKQKGVDQHPNSLIAFMVLGEIITCIQILAAFSSLQLDWGTPLKFILEWATLLAFDLDLVRISCVGIGHPLAKYMLKILMPVILLSFLVIFWLVARNVMRRVGFHWDMLFNATGALFSIAFITIALATLTPFQCYKHPNDRRSLIEAPQLLCWEDDHHTAMVGVAVCAIAMYLVGTGSVMLWAIYCYPSMIVRDDLKFVRRFRFLFYRWKPERYWFGAVVMLRNLCLAIFPMVIPPENVDVSLVLMQLSLLLCCFLMAWYHPWRTDLLGQLSCSFSVILITILSVGSVTSGSDGGLPVVSSVMLSIVLIGCLVSSAVVAGHHVSKTIRGQKHEYGAMISHHKDGGACSARFLKIMLNKMLNLPCFYDSDNLASFDGIFDAVKQSMNVIVVLSGETLCRPWVVGEIVTAHKCGIPMFACTIGCTDDTKSIDKWNRMESHEIATLYGKFEVLRPYGIELEDILPAIQNLMSLPVIHVNLRCANIIESSLDTLASKLQNVKVRKQSKDSTGFDSQASKGQAMLMKCCSCVKPPEVLLMCEPMDPEAIAAARILKNLIQEMTQKETVMDATLGGEDFSAQLSLLKNDVQIYCLVTKTTLQSPQQCARLARTFQVLPDQVVHPVIIGESMDFPGEAFYQDLADGAIFGERAADSFFEYAGAVITYEDVAGALRRLFKTIAHFVNVPYASEVMLKTSVKQFIQSAENLKKAGHGSAENLKKAGAKSSLPDERKDHATEKGIIHKHSTCSSDDDLEIGHCIGIENAVAQYQFNRKWCTTEDPHTTILPWKSLTHAAREAPTG